MPEPGFARSGALLLACALACGLACAQPALQPSSAASAAERAQKESDRTMYWIRVLATTPAPVKPVPKPAPAAPAPAEAREKPRGPAPTAAASAGAAPKAVAHGVNPVRAGAGDVSEPSALSSRSADSLAGAAASAEPAPPPAIAPVALPPEPPDPGLIQIKSVQPEFPITVVERLRTGHVEVRFEVEPGGVVVDATVVATSHPRLNAAALEAVKQWRFKPTLASHTAQVDLVFDVAHWN